jgi:SpoVK/Ycf46/Vps4 family AAA+-type ATPase
MDVKKWSYWTPMRATGRIMVDLTTYDQFQDGGRMRRNSENNTMATIPADQLWMTDPYVQGFSFMAKQWGRFAVSDITDIEFRTEAYDQLVMDPEKKAMIRALVEDNSGGFSDIISGKGGGCIFLLHGDPGVGKTLTAESVSELLQRPLYSVAVGELGTDTAQLEKSLRQILDVAQIWNAVILIDEADIFLEKRGHGDIMRNSCVSVFLRLTEYHQDVMFLTTNRVTEFDPAFYSRISVALKYDKLTPLNRRQVWQNLLSASGMPTNIDVDKLCVHEINGRQIKNSIRLARSLAKSQGVEVSTEHLEQVLLMSAQFLEDIKYPCLSCVRETNHLPDILYS